MGVHSRMRRAVGGVDPDTDPDTDSDFKGGGKLRKARMARKGLPLPLCGFGAWREDLFYPQIAQMGGDGTAGLLRRTRFVVSQS